MVNRFSSRLLSIGMVLSCFTVAEVASQPRELELRSRVDHIDTLAREPMIVEHPSGALFVSGYPSQVTGRDWTVPPLLWRSEDEGSTWARIDSGSSSDGAQGNSDVDMSMAPDGTLYLSSMGFDRDTRKGTHVAMGVSPDRGDTWRWQFLSQNTLDDRPWVAVGENGVAHAIWNGSAGVSYTQSSDAGLTWRTPIAIAKSGGSSHLAVGPDGRLAVRVSPIGASANTFDVDADYVLVSSDDGVSWTRRAIPAPIEWDPTLSDASAVPRWVEPLAWTDDGFLHHIWSEGSDLNYGVSDDLGASWSISTVSKVARTDGMAFYPYLTSNGANTLAATWFVKDSEGLAAGVAQLDRAPYAKEITVLSAAPFVPDAWDETTEHRSQTPAGEYIPVSFLANGDLAVVSPIQNIHDDRWGFTFWRFAVGSN